ncbi:hypothetical protein OAK12_00715 [Alphaproteobacteria bacterium]|nr:hypothetical protein [Alphaproteobacteria bacterium]
MKKYLFITFFCFSVFFYFPLIAQIEEGKWNFVKDPDYCYIGSSPIKIDIPEGKKRDDTYILVYRINKSKNSIVTITSGYPFKKNNDVLVKIDKTNFNFYSEDDTAWTNDDEKVIYAMKKGIDLTIAGESSRGTKTKDYYTLKGFTLAYNKLINDC